MGSANSSATAGNNKVMTMIEQDLDGIPALLVEPDGEVERNVVIWMSHLSGSWHSRRCRCLSGSPLRGPPECQVK